MPFWEHLCSLLIRTTHWQIVLCMLPKFGTCMRIYSWKCFQFHDCKPWITMWEVFNWPARGNLLLRNTRLTLPCSTGILASSDLLNRLSQGNMLIHLGVWLSVGTSRGVFLSPVLFSMVCLDLWCSFRPHEVPTLRLALSAWHHVSKLSSIPMAQWNLSKPMKDEEVLSASPVTFWSCP